MHTFILGLIYLAAVAAVAPAMADVGINYRKPTRIGHVAPVTDTSVQPGVGATVADAEDIFGNVFRRP